MQFKLNGCSGQKVEVFMQGPFLYFVQFLLLSRGLKRETPQIHEIWKMFQLKYHFTQTFLHCTTIIAFAYPVMNVYLYAVMVIFSRANCLRDAATYM